MNCSSGSASHHRQRGMSLGVVAAMLIVVGALTLLGNALAHMRAERARAVSSAERMDLVVRGLSEFAMLHKRLPCPAIGGERTGSEARRGDGCGNQAAGIVPWRTLAISETAARDRWGHALSYRVAESLTADRALLNDKVDDSLGVCLDPACAVLTHDPNTGTGAAFVVIGHGEHAPGSFIAASGQRVAGQAGVAEQANWSARGPFVDAPRSRRGVPVNAPKHFDDVVRVMAFSALRSMVTSGR